MARRDFYRITGDCVDFTLFSFILICHKTGKLKGTFFDVPLKVVIEVDVKAGIDDFSAKTDSYILQKAQKLIDFGVDRAIRILTEAQKVNIVNRNDSTWYIVNWSETISVLDDCTLQVKQLLDDAALMY